MEAKFDAGGIGPNLQHAACWHCQSWAAAVVRAVAVRHHRTQRIVATTQIQDHEISPGSGLRERQVGQELRRGKANRERRDAALYELSTCELHGALS